VYLIAGAAFSPLAAALATRLGLASWFGNAPMVAALALVALVANASAAQRFRAIAHTVSRRAPPLCPTDPKSSPPPRSRAASATRPGEHHRAQPTAASTII